MTFSLENLKKNDQVYKKNFSDVAVYCFSPLDAKTLYGFSTCSTAKQFISELEKFRFQIKSLNAPVIKILIPFYQGELAKLTKEWFGVDVVIKEYDPKFPIEIIIDGTTNRFKAAGMRELVERRIDVSETSTKKKSVYIVDDSATVRSLLTKILGKMEGFEICGQAAHPHDALKQLETLNPDVMTLDINMPDMDGVGVLKALLPKKFIPTVIVSSLNISESTQVMDALEAGAVDFIQKPSLDNLDVFALDLAEKLSIATDQRNKHRRSTDKPRPVSRIQTISRRFDKASSPIILIGASTGGTEALKDLLIRMPKDSPPIAIVQHIPPYFSKAFADRLNSLCEFDIKEAEDGDILTQGKAVVAPGGFQMTIKRMGSEYKISVAKGEKVSGHMPSVDVMFESGVPYAHLVTGVIMTGMGADGAKSLKLLKDAGAYTFGQNEESCVVYGMPKAAKKLDALHEELHLDHLAEAIVKSVQNRKAA
jgi:two-component system, chemotaxis family, protein-glutamate methylesterase/glutaminase